MRRATASFIVLPAVMALGAGCAGSKRLTVRELIDSRVVRDEQELERALTRLEAVPVFTLDGGGARRRRLMVRMRAEIDASLAGARLAKDRAARALAQVMIPEALDYPI